MVHDRVNSFALRWFLKFHDTDIIDRLHEIEANVGAREQNVGTSKYATPTPNLNFHFKLLAVTIQTFPTIKLDFFSIKPNRSLQYSTGEFCMGYRILSKISDTLIVQTPQL